MEESLVNKKGNITDISKLNAKTNKKSDNQDDKPGASNRNSIINQEKKSIKNEPQENTTGQKNTNSEGKPDYNINAIDDNGKEQHNKNSLQEGQNIIAEKKTPEKADHLKQNSINKSENNIQNANTIPIENSKTPFDHHGKNVVEMINKDCKPPDSKIDKFKTRSVADNEMKDSLKNVGSNYIHDYNYFEYFFNIMHIVSAFGQENLEIKIQN